MQGRRQPRVIRDISDAFTGTFVIFDNRLKIAPMTLDDLTEMSNWPRFEEKKLAWANFPARTEELRKQWYNQQQKGHLQWMMIRELQSGDLIGRCSITEPLSGSSVMFGIVIRPDRLGEGFGTLITQIMINYIFTVYDVETIWLESRYDNTRAHSTWEKIGFVRQGMHFRREVFGRYDRYIGYEFTRSMLDNIDLPEIEVEELD